MAKEDKTTLSVTLDGEPFDLEAEDTGEKDDELSERPEQTEDKVARKEQLEAELKELDIEEVTDVENIAEELASSDPDTGEIASESREAAKDIAGEYSLSKAQEDKIANAITQKVLEAMSGTSKPEKKRERTPDKRPKPTHFSERTVFGRRRDG